MLMHLTHILCRTIKLAGGEYGLSDGSPTVPFAEAQYARFNYDKKWKSENIGYFDSEGNAHEFAFYFEEGVEYTLYVECSLGDLKEYLERAERSLNNINACYLQILQRTGSEPDQNTDYLFYETMPEVLVTLLNEAEVKSIYAVILGVFLLCTNYLCIVKID